MSELTGDGPRAIDLDGDGRPDAEVLTDPTTGASALAADLDGDGALDMNAVDADGDGLFESVALDTDRDGLIDTVGSDTDGDGEADTWQSKDGTTTTTDPSAPDLQSPEQAPTGTAPGFAWPDDPTDPGATDGTTSTPLDLDGDGVEESVLVEDPASGVSVLVTDGDGDAVPDVVLADTDGDGLFETGAADTDADGEPDRLGSDTDGDGEVDTWEPLDGAAAPADDAPDGAAGEPAAELTAEERSELEGAFWQAQTENGFCGPTSIAIVLAEVYGVEVDAQDVVDRTIENGWLNGEPGAWSGMNLPDVEKLMETYGVPATTIDPRDEAEAWSVLEQLTADDNYGVIAYIDADEVWTTSDDDAADGGQAVDHAVVVTHVDEHYVYLNDPGISTGQQARVDRDQFMDAWADSGHQALVTDEPAPGGLSSGTATDGAGLPALDPSAGDPATTTASSPGTGAATGSSPLDLSLETTGAQPWESSPDLDLLTAVLPGLRVAILPVVLAAGAVVAVAASRRQS